MWLRQEHNSKPFPGGYGISDKEKQIQHLEKTKDILCWTLNISCVFYKIEIIHVWVHCRHPGVPKLCKHFNVRKCFTNHSSAINLSKIRKKTNRKGKRTQTIRSTWVSQSLRGNLFTFGWWIRICLVSVRGYVFSIWKLINPFP